MAEKTLVETLNDNRIRTGAMIPLPLKFYDEAHIKALADCGVDIVIQPIDDIPEDRRKESLELFAKYGIEGVLRTEETSKRYKGAHMFDPEKNDKMWYKDYPCFKYFMFVDEPGTTHYDEIKKSVDAFKEMYPDVRPYVNLLPMYANNAQLAGGAWQAPIEYFETADSTYKEYLDLYVEKIDTDHICVDIYPCQRIENPACPEKFPAEYLPVSYKDYVKNIELVADACRNSGRDFWVYIQTCSWSRWMREPNEAEIRWQAYTMLAFGAKTLLYYIMGTYSSHTGCAFDVRGDKTKTYFAIQRMALGLHKLSDVYVQYKNLGAFNVNSTPEATPYLEMYNPYKDFSAISDIKCDSPLLIGCFEKKEGEGKAFTLVNMQDFASPKTVSAKLKINGNNITVYRDGIPSKQTSSDGWYEFTLVQGDGIFVTID